MVVETKHCEICNVELDTRTNRARWTDGYWSMLCKECMSGFLQRCRDSQRRQKELKTGVGF